MTSNIPQSIKQLTACFKFADYCTILIAHEEASICHQLMQSICDHLAKWCTQNKLVINCDPEKTEAIILKTCKEINVDIPSLKIGTKSIRYVKSTKVLGIWLDDELNFKEHSNITLKKCRQKWGLLTKTTTRNNGLNVKSLCLLLKTTVLTKLFYGAPLWLHKNQGLFKQFCNNLIMKISGATLYPNRDLTELMLHLPPLNIQLCSLTVKFMCKALKDQDVITSVLAQIDGSLYNEFHNQLVAVRNFIAWKTQRTRSTRNIDLLSEETHKAITYTRNDIIQYQDHLWKQQILQSHNNALTISQ